MTKTMLTWQEVEMAASYLQRSPSARSATLLSLDFDFFTLPARIERDGKIFPDVISWQGDERLDSKESAKWWKEKAQELAVQGLEIRDCLIEHNSPSIETLSKDLKKVNHPKDAGMIGESHTWGAVACRKLFLETQKPVRLISIDRHHDLGYINADFENTWQEAQKHMLQGASCDNWIWGALHQGWISDVVLVVPDAMWYDEWRMWGPQAPKDLLKKVTRIRYSAWKKAMPRYVDEIMLVRSGAWSPPWMDEKFLRFAQRCLPGARWLDHDPSLPKIGAMNADEIR